MVFPTHISVNIVLQNKSHLNVEAKILIFDFWVGVWLSDRLDDKCDNLCQRNSNWVEISIGKLNVDLISETFSSAQRWKWRFWFPIDCPFKCLPFRKLSKDFWKILMLAVFLMTFLPYMRMKKSSYFKSLNNTKILTSVVTVI